MNNLSRVFVYELLRNGRRRAYLFTTFGFPLLLIVLFQVLGSLGGDDSGPMMDPTAQVEALVDAVGFDFDMTVGYVDLAGYFSSGFENEQLVRFDDEESAAAAMESEAISTYYIIQPDYADTQAVTLVVPSLTFLNVTQEPLRQLLFEEAGDSIPDELKPRLVNPANVREISVTRASDAVGSTGDTETVRNEDADFVLVYGFGILYMVTVFATSGYLMQSVIEEKESRLIEVLLSSLRPLQLLVGKVLALGLLGVLQITVWIAIGLGFAALQGGALSAALPLFQGISVPPMAAFVLPIYFILGYLSFAAVFAAIGALSSSMSEGPQMSTIFILPALAPFFVLGTFVSDPNGGLAVFMSLFPITSPLAMSMRVVSVPVPLAEVLLSVGLLALTDLLLFWMAARLFRVQTLLAGQMPKLRQIPGLIFSRS